MKRTSIQLFAALILLGSACAQAQSDIAGAQSNGRSLNGRAFNGVNLNGNRFNGIRWNGVILNGAKFNGARMNGPVLQGAKLNGPGLVLQSAKLNGPGLILQGLQLNGPGIVLQGRTFNGARLHAAAWEGARVSWESLSDSADACAAPKPIGHSALSGLDAARVQVRLAAR